MRYIVLFGVVLAVLFIVPSGVFAQTPAPEASPAVTTEAPIQLPEVNALEMKGPIVSAGSSTVYPLSEKIAAMFKDEGYQGNMTIDNIGSGAGFERFCKAGETDIANASREINDEGAGMPARASTASRSSSASAPTPWPSSSARTTPSSRT